MPKWQRKIALSAVVAFLFDLLSNAVKLTQDDYYDKATSKDRFKTRTLWFSPLMSNKQYSVGHGWYTSEHFFSNSNFSAFLGSTWFMSKTF